MIERREKEGWEELSSGLAELETQTLRRLLRLRKDRGPESSNYLSLQFDLFVTLKLSDFLDCNRTVFVARMIAMAPQSSGVRKCLHLTHGN